MKHVLWNIKCTDYRDTESGRTRLGFQVSVIRPEAPTRDGDLETWKVDLSKGVTKYVAFTQFCPIEVVTKGLRDLADAIDAEVIRGTYG